MQKVFNSIIDASAQRLTDKVGHIPFGVLGALWLRSGEVEAEEADSDFTF